MKKYLYTFKYHAEDLDLYQMEMKYLFNRENEESRYFESDTLTPMEDSSFGEVILEIVLCETDFPTLKEKAKELPVLHDAKLDSFSLGYHPKASFNDILKLLPAMNIHANLVNPKNIYLLTRTHENWYLGKVVSSSDKGWPIHRQKPETISSAIPHVLARTMVNILKAMGAKTLIDYCCGSGTFLIEAASIGMDCTGIDLNENMTAMAARNLKHFMYAGKTTSANASEFELNADCGIVDFPYGFHCPRDEDEEERIIDNVMNHVKTAIFISGKDFTDKFSKRGLKTIEKLVIPAVNVTRHISIVQNA